MTRLRILSVACLVLFSFGAEARAAVEIVYSNNLAPGDSYSTVGVTQAIGASGWIYTNVRTGSSVGINVANPRSGNGSVKFTGSSGSSKADVEYYDFSSGSFSPLGTLGDLNALSYEWYRDSSSTNSAIQHPALRIAYDADGNLGTSNDQGYLIYEQAYNGGGPLTTDAWVSADAFTANLWMTNTGNPNGTVLQEYDRDLTDWLTTANPNSLYPTLSAATSILGISSGFGSGWNGAFLGYVDNITIGFSGAEPRTFNFEVQGDNGAVPEPMALVVWSILGACGAVIAGRRRYLTS